MHQPTDMYRITPLILLIVCCCAGIRTLGQSMHPGNRADAFRMLPMAGSDTAKQQLYNYLGQSYLSGNVLENSLWLDSAFMFLRKSVYLTDSANKTNSMYTNTGLTLLAGAYFMAGNEAVGKKIFHQLITRYRLLGDKKSESRAWKNQISWILFAEKGDNVSIEDIDTGYNSCKRLSLELKDTSFLIDCALQQAYQHFRSGYRDLAERELTGLLDLSARFRSFRLANICFQLSVLKRYAGEYEKGVGYALKAEKLIMSGTDTTNVHDVYGELGLLYQEMNRPAESALWFRRCINNRIVLKSDQFSIYRTTGMMVIQMIKLGKAREAIVILKGLAQRDPPRSSVTKGALAQGFAYCYTSLRQWQTAERYFLEMDKYFRMQPINGELRFLALMDLARFYIDQQKFRQASPYLRELGDDIPFIAITGARDWNLLMFKVDSADNQPASAIRYFQAYKSLSDSILLQSGRKQLEELILGYEVEKKDNDIRNFEKQNRIQLMALRQANSAKRWMIAGVALMMLITILLLLSARARRRSNRILEKQKTEITQSNESLQQLVREKDWLVKEIHHRVKNNFHMVMGLLGTQTGYLKTEEATMALDESRHRVQAMSLIHQRLYQSDNLSAISMSGYIHELVDYLRESFPKGRVVRFQLDLQPVEMDLSHCVPIGLILNEAITNAIKYAFNDNDDPLLSVSLASVSGSSWELRIKDNGPGLPAAINPADPSSMGIRLMQGLAEDLDGRFSITSHAGTEIRVGFILPMVTIPAGYLAGANQTNTL
ncbi:MAG: sensor histidine kinase [Chitinophagaceae bacterium]|nr:MAG: sensor histidine kinase [Chitinophagaceae bacterium]